MRRIINPILLGEGKRESVTTLLQGMCGKLQADGCIMWRATTDSTKNKGKYTMLASWFEGVTGSFPSVRSIAYSDHNARAHASAPPGEAWLDNDFRLANPLPRHADDHFFEVHGIHHAMVMRFNYARTGRFGVVVLYRKDSKFDDACLKDLKELKDWLPNLYRAARDHTGFKLISRISPILREQAQKHEAVRRNKSSRSVDAESHWTLKEKNIEQETIEMIGEAVRDCFEGLETSVFLDSAESPGIYRCAWTDERIIKIVDVKNDQQYRASLKQPNGFSGFVLFTGESVHVYDTQHPEHDEAECRKKANDFEGHSNHAKRAASPANTHLQVNQEHQLPPPHSLVIAPITGGGSTLGFLRCWIALNNPQYYSQDDEDLLRLVALDLGRVLGEWRHERKRRTRKQQVEKFTVEAWQGGDYSINPFQPLRNTDSLTKDVLQAILELVDALVPGSDINSVRLLDNTKQEFYFYLYPPRGTLVQGTTLNDLERMTFPLSGKNLAAKVCRHPPYLPQRFEHLDVHQPPGYTELYEGVRHMIIAPIVVNGQIEGVLDIRSKSDELLDQEALDWTRIIVFFMSLLINSQRDQARVRDADIRAAKADRDLRNAFEDLAHQMKSPLVEVQNRAVVWTQRNPFSVSLRDVEIMRSLIDRTQQTTQLIQLFAAFASGRKLVVSRTMISPPVIGRVISEVCSHALHRIHPHRNIKIEYDIEQSERHAPAELRMERRLLSEALSNLVDNAIKYSSSNTTIQVSAGRTGGGRFYIGVKNKGIKVSPQDIRHMPERHWRGQEAQRYAGEGNGLGLYIVDLIMKFHAGELKITPTSEHTGLTDIRLVFPTDPMI